MKSKTSKAFINIVTGFGSQLIIIVLGIIIPRLVITQYGSDTNGVLSTISQIFIYVGLLESGIGQATRNALFKPFTEGDNSKILQVMVTSKRYYQKMSGIYLLIVVVMSLALPFILQTQMNKLDVFLVVLLEGLSNALPFYFSETEKQLINVDGKNYVISNINLITKILMYAIKIILVGLGMNIIYVQFGYFVVSLIQVIIYKRYFKRAYGWVTYNATQDKSLLADRNGYMASEFAWTVFSSTDMIVLSMFQSTKLASVYSVYNMVYTYLSTLMESAYSGLTFLLGQAFHSDRKQYIMIHDMFETLVLIVVCAVMSICYFLIMPFVRLYTEGITDIEYILPTVPILFSFVQILSWSRRICGNLVNLAGYAKIGGKISIVEAILNILLSILLVFKMGISGVLLATVITLLFKTIWVNVFANRKILQRSLFIPAKVLLTNLAGFLACVFVSGKVDLNINSYGTFFMKAILISIVVVIAFLILNFLVNHKVMSQILQWLKKNKLAKKASN
ncbi:MAG: polysaccharide biosynthesis C-terminal domain-containing protein [Ruminococcus sp.]|nr:polysaccharide biosynthesis C-terminal domain-containing protein [Ruminococcus sp.]